MIDSNIARCQGAAASSSGTGLIELGIFYQALRQTIAVTNDTVAKQEWTAYLYNSTASAVPLFVDIVPSAQLPLDRLSIGTGMIRQSHEKSGDNLETAIRTLRDSLDRQPRNGNGGLWYYNNPKNLTAYQNLSYADGIRLRSFCRQKQLEILEAVCKDGTGLLVHGYDALKAHSWANPETGASPSVWGRSLAWYTLGVVEALDALRSMPQVFNTLADRIAYTDMRLFFESLIKAQIVALERATATNGNYGVWQVVDLPGASIDNTQNFIETSASLMTAYSLLKSVRLEFITSAHPRTRAIRAGLGLWENIFRTQVTRIANGTLSLGGTSSIATLSVQDVNAQYYFSRPTVNNSLIGTSAFILASLEVERLCA